MLRGYYTAASGILTQQTRLNAVANNIANSGTAGYKKDDVTLSTFGEHIAVRMNTYEQSPLNEHGRGVWMQVTDSKYTDYTQGGFEQTGRSLDLAVQGEGFFVINTPDGERLTRDGQFGLDAEGYLILPGFGRVQGEGGDIQLETSYFVVAPNGTIYRQPEDPTEEMEEVDRLSLAIPADYAALEKEPSGLYLAQDFTLAPEAPQDTMVRQGFTERSNVDMTQEMTRMLASQRSLQSASQIVKMYDQMAEEGTSKLSRV